LRAGIASFGSFQQPFLANPSPLAHGCPAATDDRK